PDLSLYDHGTLVTLTASPAAGSHFVRWSGDVVDTAATTSVTMNSAKSITAAFALNTILLAGTGFETGLQGWGPYGNATLARSSPGHGGSSYAARLTGSNTKELGISGTLRVSL